MSEAATPAGPDRTAVVAAAIDLFLEQGFEATSVEQIAQAAGVSRSTFFRQFGGKDDVVFADHELLLAQLRDYLAQPHDEPVGGRVRGIHPGLRALRREPRRRPPPLPGGAPGARAAGARDHHGVPVRAALRRVPPPVAARPRPPRRRRLRRPRDRDAQPRAPPAAARQARAGRRCCGGAMDDVLRRFGVHPDTQPPAADDIVVAVFPGRCRRRRSPGGCGLSSTTERQRSAAHRRGGHVQIIGAVLERAGAPTPFADPAPSPSGPLELDPPGTGELLIRIEAAGVCHSDLSVVDGNRAEAAADAARARGRGHRRGGGTGRRRRRRSARASCMTFLPRCGACAGCRTDGRLPCEVGGAANAAGTLVGGGIRLHRADGAADPPPPRSERFRDARGGEPHVRRARRRRRARRHRCPARLRGAHRRRRRDQRRAARAGLAGDRRRARRRRDGGAPRGRRARPRGHRRRRGRRQARARARPRRGGGLRPRRGERAAACARPS